MSASRIVFICEQHLIASDEEQCCPTCGLPMLRCDAGKPGSERSLPLYDDQGRLRTHAPRWWLERRRSDVDV